MDKWSLKALRVNMKMSQEEASKKLGISQKTLSNWENSVTFPDQQAIEKICELYDVAYDRINFDA